MMAQHVSGTCVWWWQWFHADCIVAMCSALIWWQGLQRIGWWRW